MVIFRLSLFLVFSTLLIACQTPFIDIDISSGQTRLLPKGPQAGCGWPVTVCPGVSTRGIVEKKISLGHQTIYSVKEEHSDTIWNILVPPAQVIGDSTIEKDSFVEIGTQEAIQTISVVN